MGTVADWVLVVLVGALVLNEIDRRRHKDCVCHELHKINETLAEIASILRGLVVPTPTGFAPIVQIAEGEIMTGNQVNPGVQAVFNTSYVPAGAVPPSGSPAPVWAASDPSVVLTPDPSDPSGLTIDVMVPAGSTLTSFQLGISQALAAGTITGGPITVTVVQPTPPVPTGFGPINQVS